MNERKLDIDFDMSQSPPKGLQAKSVGDMLQVIVKVKYFSLFGIVIIALVIWGLFFYFTFGGKNWVTFVILSVLFFILGVKALVSIVFTRASIKIGENTIFVNAITPWGETAGTTIVASEIESVVVSGYEVLIKTDERQVAIGRGLSAEALQWLKNCILTITST